MIRFSTKWIHDWPVEFLDEVLHTVIRSADLHGKDKLDMVQIVIDRGARCTDEYLRNVVENGDVGMLRILTEHAASRLRGLAEKVG